METTPAALETKKTRCIWTNEQTKRFLHHVGQHPCLWPGQLTPRNKKCVRSKKQVAAAMGMTIDAVHQKIIVLIGQYQRETKRRIQNRRLYEWYDEASFLAKNEELEFSAIAEEEPEPEEEIATDNTETKPIHSRMCRVCLATIDVLNALAFQEFSTQFTDCTGFGSKLYTEEPAFICAGCRDELLVCWTFLDRAKQTELVLQQNLLPINDEAIKTEIGSMEAEKVPNLEFNDTLEHVKLEIEILDANFRISSDRVPEPVNPEPEPVDSEPKSIDSNFIVCFVCGKSVSRSRYRSHMIRYHHTNRLRFGCDICGKSYKDKGGLAKHMRHHTNEKRYKCQFCDLKFLEWGARRFHIRSKHMVEKPFHCHLCGKGFLSKAVMKAHIQGDHLNITWDCDKCEKTFTKKNNYQKHCKNVHGNSKLLACDRCGKNFKTKKYLRQHQFIHTGEKNYVCPVQYCEKSFAQNHVLRNHVEKVHPEAVDELPPPGTVMSVKAVERLKEMQNIDFVKTDEFF
jgi:predicted transcriptional regulator